MKKIFYLLIILLMYCNLDVMSQGCTNVTIYKYAYRGDTTYINTSGDTVHQTLYNKTPFTAEELTNGVQLNCDHPLDTIIAIAENLPRQTTSYAWDSIEYNPPYAFNSGTNYILPTDDVWGELFSLGFGRPPEPPLPDGSPTPTFKFNFYGNDYLNVVAGSNNLLSFDISVASGSPISIIANRSSCAWSYTASIPSTSLYKNTIMGPYHDIDFNYGGEMRFQVVGSYPCRKIILSFYQVPMFSCHTLCTDMMVLYETSNVIEFYLKDKPLCATWNGGRGILGIQNSTGTQACAIPGLNSTQWTATNKAYRIYPTGPQNDAEIFWYKKATKGNTATVPLSTDALFRELAHPSMADSTTYYIAKAHIYRLTGEEFDVYDTVIYKPYDIREIKIAHNSSNPLTVASNSDSLSYRDTICKGDNVTFNLHGGDKYYFIQPSTLTNTTINDSSITIQQNTSVDSVKYIFRVDNLNSDGTISCTRTDSCVIYNHSFSVDLGKSDTICKNKTVTYTDILNQESGTYLWSTGATTDTLTYSPPSTGYLHLTKTDKFGCKASDSALIVVNDAPIINITGTTSICNGTSTTLTVNSSLNNCIYSWSNGKTEPRITVSPNDTTTYTVSVKFPPAMCEAIDSIKVKVFNAPKVTCCEDKKLCNGDNTTINVVGDASRYVWESFDNSVNNGNETNYTVSPSSTTTYIAHAYNDINCHSTDTVIVFVEQKPEPVISFNPSYIDALTPQVVFTDRTLGDNSRLWEISDGTTSTDRTFLHTFVLEDSSIAYTISLTETSSFGCVDSVSTIIRVKRDHYLYAPTGVYLYDNNERNRTFRLFIDNLSEYNLKIFNRWGTCVYETNDINKVWDCTYKGKMAQEGVYVWKVQYRHNDSPNHLRKDSGSFVIYN